MKKNIPIEILFSYTVEEIFSFMKENNIGMNDPILVISGTNKQFYPSILYKLANSGCKEDYVKEFIKRGANVNVVDRTSNKTSIFECLIVLESSSLTSIIRIDSKALYSSYKQRSFLRCTIT